jgi:hypothetical protein
MRKTLLMAIVFVAAGFSPIYLHADEMKGDMMGAQEPGKGMKDMHGMMKHMMPPSMVATNDGGVIVLSGRTLTKYDKDLNVVKEVELQGPKMGGMGMMDREDKDEGENGKPADVPAAPAPEADHPANQQ